MFKNLTLTRPLAILDLETTGTDTSNDRIVEISILKLAPGMKPKHRTRQVNPGIPIPASATAIHGITDEDVVGAPLFPAIAKDILKFLDGCDLCGFHIRGFDLKLLRAELKRCGLVIELTGRFIIDPMKIYHDREKRDLTAAMRFYCDSDHEGAHGSAADVLATVAVLDAMIVRYDELPCTPDELHFHCSDPDAVDFDEKFKMADGEIVFTFGKHKGTSIDEVARNDASYLRWILGQDFEADTLEVVRSALNRI